MKTVRLLFWLVLMPTVLLIAGYWLTAFISADRSGEREDRDRQTHNERMLAQAERDTAAYLARRIAAQETLARECLAQVDRATGNALRDADPLLVIVSWEGCGVGCDTEATATALADEWRFYGLRVLLLRTLESRRASSPAGVTTLVMPQCEALANTYGDDYFLRYRDGTLSNGGEVFMRRLGGAEPFDAPFNPTALLREHYGIR
jgi:hypothetical protein